MIFALKVSAILLGAAFLLLLLAFVFTGNYIFLTLSIGSGLAGVYFWAEAIK